MIMMIGSFWEIGMKWGERIEYGGKENRREE
jgi:hypothetical protein